MERRKAKIWPSNSWGEDEEWLEPWEEMGWELKCYLEEKGCFGAKLHAHGDGSSIAVALPNTSHKLVHDVIKRSIFAIAHRYDYYIDVCEKPHIEGFIIHVLPKKGWKTCQI